MKKVFYFIFCFVLVIVSFPITYANESITDIKENIKSLQARQDEILSQNNLYSLGEINSYISGNITKDQKLEYNAIVINYNYEANILKTSGNISELLNLKKKTYDEVMNYVDKDFKEQYITYTTANLDIISIYINLEAEKEDSNRILEGKINNIKEKITKNNETVQNNLSEIINTKVDEKINSIENNETFQKLDIDKKKYVIESIIDYTEKKNEQNKQNYRLSTTSSTENMIYNVVINKLNKLYSNLK